MAWKHNEDGACFVVEVVGNILLEPDVGVRV